MSKTPLKDFTDAAKLDILNILSADKPGVFEFRRALDITRQMVDFVNSYGTPVEHGAFVQAINMAESKAPNFHSVLLGRAFDGDSLLHKKYEQMLNEHTQLRHAALNIADAQTRIARDRAEELFGCEHVNVQPHSGSQANMAVYFAVLKPGDTIMGLNLSHGGHLTHGHPINFSGKLFHVEAYSVSRETETIDYDELMKRAS